MIGTELIQVDTAAFLAVLTFIVGAIAGYAIARNRNMRDDFDCDPRPSASRDVRTPGCKLVAMPRVVKPSSAWPMYETKQRVQSQVERGDAA